MVMSGNRELAMSALTIFTGLLVLVLLSPFVLHTAPRYWRFRRRYQVRARRLRLINDKIRRGILINKAEGKLLVYWCEQGFVRLDLGTFLSRKQHKPRYQLRFDIISRALISQFLDALFEHTNGMCRRAELCSGR
jgi:hypothetical protein